MPPQTDPRARLIAEIDRNCQAILDESRRFSPALDRRNYTAMSPDAAAHAYAHDDGIAEAQAENRTEARDALYDALRDRVAKHGLKGLPQTEIDAVLLYDGEASDLGLRLTLAAMAHDAAGQAVILDRLADRAAAVIVDLRMPE